MEALKVRRLPVINKSKRMVGILSLGDVSHSAPNDLLSECVKSVSAHHRWCRAARLSWHVPRGSVGYVRFGSLADTKSRSGMSASPLRADMLSMGTDVR